MADLPEVEVYDAGVYQLEITDPVVGGANGISNAPVRNLANRTKWLKARVDSLLSSLSGVADSLAAHLLASDPHTQYATKAGVQGVIYSHATAGGTADAITATYTPAIAQLADGMTLYVKATGANLTTAPTFSPNGLTARPIVKGAGTALIASDIIADGHILEIKYRADITSWVLQNPSTKGLLIDIKVFTASGTYTATAGTRYVIVYGCGGGESGGLAEATLAGYASSAPGGSSGSHGKSKITAGFNNTIVTIGAGGVAAFSATCSPGGTTSFGAFLTLQGGSGGTYGAQSTGPSASAYGIGGVSSGGNIYNAVSGLPNSGIVFNSGTILTGNGGSTPWGVGGYGFNAALSGSNGRGYGAGGGGAGSISNTPFQRKGGNGTAGVLFIEEYS